MILLYITIGLFVLYSGLIIYYWIGWKSIPVFILGNNIPRTRISVIIPARNEEKNIRGLLRALETQTYPSALFETIVIDDHSMDETATIVSKFPTVKLVSLEENNINSYKKKAIETGIALASGELIVTTDADCIPPPGWLMMIASYQAEKDAVAITAPVVINCNSSLLQIFQAMDFMVLQGITGATVYKQLHAMCNGANLAYKREAFYEVDGFKGVDHIASGDDMLLMHKIWKKYPGRMHYLKSKEAVVPTEPMKTWKEFFNQRIRWASKARKYEDKKMFPVLLLVYLFNLSFLGLLVAGCWLPGYLIYAVGFWLVKTLVELPFFYSVAKFFDKGWAVWHFFFFQPLHIFYTVISGLFGQYGRYNWKGRTVK